MDRLWYRLQEDKTPVACNIEDINQSASNILAKTELEINNEKVRVSTVFLNLNHNYSDQGPPVLFETMIFGGKHDSYQDRYTSYEDAMRGHYAVVDRLNGLDSGIEL